MDRIRKRFPQRRDLLAVFGIAVFVCYSWTLLGFLDKLSSFLLYFTVGEIADIFAFMMAFALLESLAATAALALLSGLLPSGWLREGFALKGFIVLVIAAAASILFQMSLGDEYPPALMLAASVLVPLALIVAVIALVGSLPKVRDILNNIQDRIQIMLFVYVPIGLVSLLVVAYKNPALREFP